MSIINYIKEYWVQIASICALLFGMYKFAVAMIEAERLNDEDKLLAPEPEEGVVEDDTNID